MKIGDFGISKLVSNGETALRTSRIGTQGFQAPEVLRLLDEALETSVYTHAVDIWSLGCVLYLLKCRKLPFPGASLWAYCQGYLGVPDSPLRSAGMTDGGIKFLEELLAVDPSKRPSAANALQSPWILQHGSFKEDLKRTVEERHQLAMDTMPSTSMPLDLHKGRIHTTQLRSDQTALEPPLEPPLESPLESPLEARDRGYGQPPTFTAPKLQQNANVPHIDRAFDPQLATRFQQSPQNRAREPIQSGAPHLQYFEMAPSYDARDYRNPIVEPDTGNISSIAPISSPEGLSLPSDRKPDNIASNDRVPSRLPDFPSALTSQEATKNNSILNPSAIEPQDATNDILEVASSKHPRVANHNTRKSKIRDFNASSDVGRQRQNEEINTKREKDRRERIERGERIERQSIERERIERQRTERAHRRERADRSERAHRIEREKRIERDRIERERTERERIERRGGFERERTGRDNYKRDVIEREISELEEKFHQCELEEKRMGAKLELTKAEEYRLNQVKRQMLDPERIENVQEMSTLQEIVMGNKRQKARLDEAIIGKKRELHSMR